MNRHSALSAFLIAFFILAAGISVHAAESAATRPDIVIKISRLNQAIRTIDSMAATDIDQPNSAPSSILRSALFGTDWIDPARSIVIGIDFKNMAANEKPVMVALVPYTRQNEDFHLSYNAIGKIDHYLVSLPPTEGATVSDQMALDLAEASRTPTDGMVSIEVAASQLLNKADSQIQKMLLEFESQLGTQATTANDLNASDINQLLKSLINTAKQLETISIGMDVAGPDLVIFSDAQALNGTDLSKLFTRSAESRFSRLGKYMPRYHINFKSVSYDVKGMMAFLDRMFGAFYKKIGFDLAGLESLASHFTGETAGGMSFNDKGMDIEMIAVLKDNEKNGADFLESVYVPWMMDYGQKMASLYYHQAPGEPAKNLFSKTPESTLYGNKVFGMDCEVPVGIPDISATDKIKFQLRATSVNNLLLIAPNDEGLKQLIKMAATLDKQPYDGPLMKMEMDLGAYIEAVRKMIPQTKGNTKLDMPDLGSLVYTCDMENKKFSNKYVVQIDDIKSMVAALKQAQGTAVAAEDRYRYSAEQSFSQNAPTMLHDAEKGQKPKPKKEGTAEFWLDKGMLYATYGNDKEAIKYFKKSLAIEPDNTRALFNLGLSYSSQGHYNLAIHNLTQAVSLAPDNGDYLYGLGWVYLLKGESGKAMTYIRSAADLGNPDAQKYLLTNQPKAE